MAEAIAVVGLLASIAELVKLSSTVISRVMEYQNAAKGLPKAFRAVKIELPLISDALKKIDSAAESGDMQEDTVNALKPVLSNCHESVASIDEMISKAMPPSQGSYFDRGVKAVTSLRLEREVEKTLQVLRQQLAVLNFHAGAFLYGSRPAKQIRKPVVLLPFARDKKYLDRPDLMERLTRQLQDNNMAVITGLGGVG